MIAMLVRSRVARLAARIGMILAVVLGSASFAAAAYEPNVQTATHLAYSIQPGTPAVDTDFVVAVQVLDASNGLVTTSTALVALQLSTGPADATLHGSPLTVNAVGGVATFPNLSLDQIGVYTLLATSPLLGSVVSSSFPVVAGNGSQLVFTVPPVDHGADTTFAVTVTVEDPEGNTVTTSYGNDASISIRLNDGSVAMTGTKTVTAVNGVATFTGLSVTQQGNYNLIAEAINFGPADTGLFHITAGAPHHLAFTSQPPVANQVTNPFGVVVSVEDVYDNVVADSAASITIALTSGVLGVLNGTKTMNAMAGEAVFDNLQINAGGTYTITATSPGIASATSHSFQIANNPLSVVFYARMCDSYTQVPANQDPTTPYAGWGGDDTGGHAGQLDTSYQTAQANANTDLACSPTSGTFQLLDGPDKAHGAATDPTLLDTESVGINGSSVALTDAEISQARVAGLFVRSVLDPHDAGFGALRCFDDVQYSDNAERLVVPNYYSSVVCILYEVKPRITFAGLPNRSEGDTFSVSATTTATGPGVAVTFQSTTPSVCSVDLNGSNGETLSAGQCTIAAHELMVPGASNFWAVPDDVTRSFLVSLPAATCQVVGYDFVYSATPHTVSGTCLGSGGDPLPATDLQLGSTTHTNAGTYTDSWFFHDPTGHYADLSGQVTDIIEQAPMSLTLGNGTKTYGTTFGGVITLVQSGLVSVTDSVDCVRTSAGFASSAPVGHYPITCGTISGVGIGNYDITSITAGDLEVKPAPLTITATGRSKSYGQSLDLGTTAFTTTDLATGDAVTGVTLDSSGATGSADAGSYAITPSAAVGTGLTNYAITYGTGTLSVGKRELTVRASNSTMTYGSTPPTITPVYSGFVNGDGPSVLSGSFDCYSDARSSTSLGAYRTFCRVALDALNYHIGMPDDGVITIAPAPLHVQASSASMMQGDVPPAINAVISGYLNGEGSGVLDVAPGCHTEATSASAPGIYRSYCGGGRAANYTFDYSDGSVVVQRLSISLAKSADRSSFSTAGQTITYTYKITNTGNMAIGPTQFKVTDNRINGGAPLDCGSASTTIAIGGSMSCTAAYVVTQADVDAGSVTNTATASVAFASREATSNPATLTINAVQGPAFGLAKTADKATFAGAGETITYTYTLTNTGNVTLDGPFTVSDDKIAAVDCSAAAAHLAPGAHTSCTAPYVITAADVTAGGVTNHATAYGHYAEPDEVGAAAPNAVVAITSNATAATVLFRTAATPAPSEGQEVLGATATPRQATPPPTNTGTGSSGGGSDPWVLLICLTFAAFATLAVQTQRRSLRS